MTEDEYINARELEAVTNIKNIVRDIIPANSNAISKDDYIEIYSMIDKWQQKLFEITKIDE